MHRNQHQQMCGTEYYIQSELTLQRNYLDLIFKFTWQTLAIRLF